MTYETLLNILQDLKFSDPEVMKKAVMCIESNTREEFILCEVNKKLPSKIVQLEIAKIIDYTYEVKEEN